MRKNHKSNPQFWITWLCKRALQRFKVYGFSLLSLMTALNICKEKELQYINLQLKGVCEHVWNPNFCNNFHSKLS